MNIVLLEPEQPGNVKAIGRTCVVTNSPLHIIYPTPVRLHTAKDTRAGLDYWEKVQLFTYIDWEDFISRHEDRQILYATTKAPKTYADVRYEPDAFIVFGKESAGIPEEILKEHPDTTVRIPMLPDIRSLNLSNSAAIVLYEALRQTGFAGMQTQGELHRLKW